jgi:hypothetical protein
MYADLSGQLFNRRGRGYLQRLAEVGGQIGHLLR